MEYYTSDKRLQYLKTGLSGPQRPHPGTQGPPAAAPPTHTHTHSLSHPTPHTVRGPEAPPLPHCACWRRPAPHCACSRCPAPHCACSRCPAPHSACWRRPAPHLHHLVGVGVVQHQLCEGRTAGCNENHQTPSLSCPWLHWHGYIRTLTACLRELHWQSHSSKNTNFLGLPWWTSDQDSTFPLQRARV